MISPCRVTNIAVTLSPSHVMLSVAKHLYWLRVNSAKNLRPLETSVAEILRFAALAQNDMERRAHHAKATSGGFARGSSCRIDSQRKTAIAGERMTNDPP